VLCIEATPPNSIILHPITPHPRCHVGNRPLHRPAWQGVIKDRARHGAGGHVLDVLPAVLFAGTSPFPFAGESDAGEALAVGEHDAAIHVVPGVAFVLLHHRELHAVDGDQFFEGELEGLGHQHIDLHQGLAAGVIGAQCAIALPGGGEVGEEGVGEAGILFSPALLAEGFIPAFAPKIGVVGGEAVEGESAYLNS
jgi:hypothetical protein